MTVPRPELLGIDAVARPYHMRLLFRAPHPRVITVRLRTQPAGLGLALAAAHTELAAFTPAQLELLYDAAKPVRIPAPVPPDPAPSAPALLEASIRPLTMESRPNGNVHCPRCAARLGRADSPAIGYVKICPGCRRELAISFVGGCVVVAVSAEEA